MLYNKDWDKTKVEIDPYSLDDLIEWLKKKPAEKTYIFNRSDLCLMAKWAAEFGGRRPSYGHTFYYEADGRSIDLDYFGRTIANALPFTYGAALKRAKHLRGDRWWKFW